MSTDRSVGSEVLVLGIGNILLSDEGVGVRALQRLQERHSLPEQVLAVDGGTMGLDLLPYIEQTSSLLILDSVESGNPPGSLVRLEGGEIPAALALNLSVHQVGFQELLAACLFRGTLPSRIVLWGIEPAVVNWGLGLSAPVAASLDDLTTAAASELQSWGVSISPYK